MKKSTSNPEITAVLDVVRQGLMQRNTRTIAAAYAPDATIFDLAPPLSHSFDADSLQEWLDKWGGPVDQSVEDLQVTVDGEIAFGHGLVHIRTQTATGETAAWWMRLTVCLSRQNGRWRITHEHTSVPFHMDGSFRAAVDLTP